MIAFMDPWPVKKMGIHYYFKGQIEYFQVNFDFIALFHFFFILIAK